MALCYKLRVKAPVVKWISLVPSKHSFQVRVLAGAQNKGAGRESVLRLLFSSGGQDSKARAREAGRRPCARRGREFLMSKAN